MEWKTGSDCSSDGMENRLFKRWNGKQEVIVQAMEWKTGSDCLFLKEKDKIRSTSSGFHTSRGNASLLFSCLVLSCLVLPCFCHVLSCGCLIIACVVFSCHFSYLVMSCNCLFLVRYLVLMHTLTHVSIICMSFLSPLCCRNAYSRTCIYYMHVFS